MRLHGRLAEEEPLGDLGVGESAGDQLEATSSSRSVSSASASAAGRGAGRATKRSISRRVIVGASSASPRRPSRTACDAVDRRHVLEQEPAGAGSHRLVDVLVEVEGRQHQHAAPSNAPSSSSRRVASMPSSTGMRMSMRHDVRRELARLLDRIGRRRPRRRRRCPSSRSRISRKPLRTSAWSSAISTRITRPVGGNRA